MLSVGRMAARYWLIGQTQAGHEAFKIIRTNNAVQL